MTQNNDLQPQTVKSNCNYIEIFEGLGIIYFVANALGLLFNFNGKSIRNWKQSELQSSNHRFKIAALHNSFLFD